MLGFLYNVTAKPPGPPSYAVAPTDPEMWDVMPTPRDALDLLTDVTRFGAVDRTRGSAPAPLSMFRVDPDPANRLDGIALAFRAWAVDTSTAGGRAVFENLGEGYCRLGDVAASPERRDLRLVTAVSREGARAALTKSPAGGPVQDVASAWGLDPGGVVKFGGRVADGLAALLAALCARPALRR